METLKDFDPGTVFPVTYAKDKHEASETTQIIRVTEKMEWEIVPK